MAGKSDLVSDVKESLGGGLTGFGAAVAVEAILGGIKERVAAGERVTIQGFGTFYRKETPARVARNPQNGEPVMVPAKRTIGFRPSADVTDVVS